MIGLIRTDLIIVSDEISCNYGKELVESRKYLKEKLKSDSHLLKKFVLFASLKALQK